MKTKVTVGASLLMLVVSGAGCSRKSDSPATPAVAVEEVADGSIITVPHPEQFPLVAVESRRLAEQIHVNGVVAPDVNRSVPVLSLAGGRVVDTKVRLGDEVKKDQVLLLIHSPDLAAAFSDYHKFAADEQLARKQLDRSQLLLSHGAIAQRDFESAQDADSKAKVDLATAEDRLHALGADPQHPSSILPVRAPISGTIIEQNITSGTGVRSLDNSPNLFTIADMSRVWVLCDVYEDMLPSVNVGDIASIRLNAYLDREFKGKVSNISRVLDPNTRAAKVRIELDNPQKIMRAGMFVTASFQSQRMKETMVIPTSAITRIHDRDWVFLPESGNKFRKVDIQLGQTLLDNMQEVRAGLHPGDKVVSNALQLSSASEAQ
jgi:cobalt-zinc-cadmium efflux system membrane fusion protein